MDEYIYRAKLYVYIYPVECYPTTTVNDESKSYMSYKSLEN